MRRHAAETSAKITKKWLSRDKDIKGLSNAIRVSTPPSSTRSISVRTIFSRSFRYPFLRSFVEMFLRVYTTFVTVYLGWLKGQARGKEIESDFEWLTAKNNDREWPRLLKGRYNDVEFLFIFCEVSDGLGIHDTNTLWTRPEWTLGTLWSNLPLPLCVSTSPLPSNTDILR